MNSENILTLTNILVTQISQKEKTIEGLDKMVLETRDRINSAHSKVFDDLNGQIKALKEELEQTSSAYEEEIEKLKKDVAGYEKPCENTDKLI